MEGAVFNIQELIITSTRTLIQEINYNKNCNIMQGEENKRSDETSSQKRK